MAERLSGLGPLRLALAGLGIASVLVALGFALKLPLVTALWPYQVTPLTYYFLTAYTLGSAAVLLWIAVTGELAGLGPLGIVVAVSGAGLTLTVLSLIGSDGRLAGTLLITGGLLGAWLLSLWLGFRQPRRDQRATPRSLIYAYVVMVPLLLGLGVILVLRVAILPWDVDLNSGALMGCYFLGSAAYFTFAIVRPAWAWATGPLLAFLAYDVVLAPPLIAHIGNARPEHMVVLLVYIAAVVGSGLIAAWFFLVDRRTRWGTRG